MVDDYLAISKINTVVYCPRRYFIEVVLSENISNHHLIEGAGLHERTVREGEAWVWSDSLGIVGIADQVKREAGKLVPYEFKKGRVGQRESDRAQLCAIALCLEEQRQTSIEYGYIYYHYNRQKVRVDIDEDLRRDTLTAIGKMREINGSSHFPPVIDNPQKCRGCSVYEACQPKLSQAISRAK